MNWITTEEAIELYARFWVSRHGNRAIVLAREEAKNHERRGDTDGSNAWSAVATAIERTRQPAQV